MKPTYIDEAHERFFDYQENIELYKAKAFHRWGLNQKDYFKTFHKDNNKSYINFNFIKLFAEKMTDLILSKGFYIKTNNKDLNQWLNDWIEANDYLNLQSKKLQFGFILGDSPVKISTRKNQRGEFEVKADYINPDKWYIIADERNINIEKGQAIVHEYTIDKQTYYLVEEHYCGKIVYKLFKQDSKNWVQLDIETNKIFLSVFEGLKHTIDGADYVVETGTFYPTLINYQNDMSFDSVYGSSDFDLGTKSLMYNINDTITGVHATNSMTRDPLYSVPNGTIKGILDARKQQRVKKTDGSILTQNPYKTFTADINNAINSNRNDQIDMLFAREYLSELLYKSRAVEKSVDGQSLEVVEHNPQMQNSFDELKKLELMLYQVTSISPVLIDPEYQSGNLSGTAIRNLAIATLKKASRKAKNLIKSMQKELWTIQELAISANLNIPVSKPELVTIEINDGLGNDPSDDILWIEKAVNLGLINRTDSIAILRDLSSSEAKQKALELEVLEPVSQKLLDNNADNQDIED
jgi:hypothetical protein